MNISLTKVKLKFFLVSLFLLAANLATAQVVGDYRDNLGILGAGNWSTLATWQRWNGAWVTPTALQGYPGQFGTPNTVTYISPLSVLTLDVSPIFNLNNLTSSTGFLGTLQTTGNVNLTLNGNLALGALDIMTFGGTGNLIVNGTSQIDGFFTDNNNGGLSRFVGAVTLTGIGTWTTTAVTTSANLVFRGGIVNGSAAFTAGGATFDTNNQALSGATASSFANNIIITGVTLTNSNTGNLTITGTTSGTGSFTDSNNAGIDTFTGNVNLTGSFITTLVTTTANLVFQGGITNSGTSFTAGGATFNTNAQAISGTTASSFANNVSITGIIITYSNTNNLSITGTTSGTGSFTDSNNAGIDTFTGNVNLTGDFNTTAVTTTANLIFQGGVTSSGTSFVAGGATFNTNAQSVSGTTGASFANSVIVTGITVSNTNTASVTMTNTAVGTLAGTGTWTQGVNSTLNYAGATITITTLNASNSGNIVNYNSTTVAQTVFTPSASTYFHLTLSGIGNITKTLSANTILSGNISIQNTAIFSVGTFSLSVAGNWTNSSSNADPLVEGAQTVTFNGAAAQAITNTGNANGTFFNNVTTFNTFGTSPQITLNSGNVVVGSTLTMTQGNINLNSFTLTIGKAAATPGSLVHTLASAAGWMYGGNLIRFFNIGTIADGSVTGFFPMGNATNFRPFFLSCPVSGITTGGTFTLSHSAATNTTVVSIPDTNPVATIVVQHQASWTVAPAGMAGGTYNLVAGGTGFGTIGSLADLRLCKSASVVGTNAIATNTTADPRLHRTGLTLLQVTTTGGNQFFVGSTNAASSPLPIELVSFSGEAKPYGVDLRWTTDSELNNDHFTVSRSGAGTHFEDIGTIKGNGTTIASHTYTLTDYKPKIGKNYYQLTQTDFDGHSTSSELIEVDVLSLNPLAKIYPNPVSKQQLLHIEINMLQANSPTEIQILNMQGNKVNESTANTDSDGLLKAAIDAANLSPGLYILRVQGWQFKFILE